MARERSPNRDKAFELYKESNGKIQNREIANILGISEKTVSGWKTKDKWISKLNGVLQINERSTPKEKKKNDNDISWLEIENEYVTDIRKNPCSLESLSKKYKIPLQTIKDYSSKNQWSKKRTEYKLNTNQKIVEKTAEIISDDIAKYKAQHLSITDNILNQINKALDNPNELYSFVEKFREGNGDGSYTEYSDVKIHDTLNENKVVKIVTAVEKLQRMQRQTLDILSVDAQERLELERKKVEIAQSKVPSKEQVSLQGQITALADLINNPVEERVLDDD